MSGMQGKSAPLAHLNDGDQKDHEGKKHQHVVEDLEGGEQSSHNVKDPLDRYSLADRAAKEQKEEQKEEEEKLEADHVRPTDVAKSHSNKPSRGAAIDQQIEDEEAEVLRRKDESQKAKQGNN